MGLVNQWTQLPLWPANLDWELPGEDEPDPAFEEHVAKLLAEQDASEHKPMH